MKKLFLFLLLFVCTFSIRAQEILIPTPLKYITTSKESFVLGTQIQIVKGKGVSNIFCKSFKEKISQLNIQQTVSTGNIELQLTPERFPDNEAYRLTVSPKHILLEAANEVGLFYAQETILQLARIGKGQIGTCVIEDRPRYIWRGFMLDESRHFFGKEKVKKYLDIMASLKLNVFHWHLTDETGWRIEIKRYPKLTTEGAIGNWSDPKAPARYYTQKDIKEIVAYAAERHITVIPEFDMPGHAKSVCRAYPEISGGGEGRWQHFTFHPCKEETYEFISNVLDELIQLFPAPYIHIGGDEVHFGNQSWFTDPLIQRFIQEHDLKNEVGLEQYFIRRIADIVYKKGRKIIAWDEAVDAGVSPEKMVVMWWRHDRKYQLVKALENGYQVIMTPRRPLYGDFLQYGSHKIGRYWGGYNTIETIYNFPESVSHLLKGYEDQIMGLQFAMWTERITNEKRLDFMTFPRIAAVAEDGWTWERNKDCSVFMRKLPHFLNYLDTMGIIYFNPFNPNALPEPEGPKKEDVLQNG